MYTSAHNTTTLVHPHDMTFSNATLSVLVLVSLVLTVLALYLLLAPGRVRQRRSRAQSSLPSDAPLDVLVQAQSKAIKRLDEPHHGLAEKIWLTPGVADPAEVLEKDGPRGEAGKRLLLEIHQRLRDLLPSVNEPEVIL